MIFKKAMTTKLFYTKSNLLIHQLPWIHALALYHCVKAEKCSKVLEMYFYLRYRKLLSLTSNSIGDYSSKDITAAYDSVVSGYKKHYYSECPDDYRFEDQINARLGLSFGGLLKLFDNFVLEVE